MINLKYKQHGSTTILVSVATLMLITMVTVMNANISIMGTKTSANEYRTLQALLSAQAGIDFALSNLNKDNLVDINNNGSDIALFYVEDDNTEIVTGYYTVTVTKDDAPLNDNITITATGKSADQTAVKVLTQQLIFSPALRGDAKKYISAPLVTSEDAEIDADNIDFDTASARVWAGGVITGSNIPASDIEKVAAKLFEDDDATANPGEKLFSSSMRRDSNKGLKHSALYKDCGAGGCSNPTKLIATPERPELHYYEQSLTLNDVTVGSAEYPAFLFVDLSNGGNLILRSGAIVHGIIYVHGGNWDNQNNNATINGAVIVNGNLANGDSLTINFKQTLIDNMVNMGVYTRLPGSWTDS